MFVECKVPKKGSNNRLVRENNNKKAANYMKKLYIEHYKYALLAYNKSCTYMYIQTSPTEPKS